MEKAINGCVRLEKQGNHLSMVSEELGAMEVLLFTLFSAVSLAKSEGIPLERLHEMLDTFDQRLELEECEQKHE
ncbi:hypothetical protein [Enterococcus sp. 5B3_DIV0040]|uniref:hypothetical protein n=1 Tax=Enterococcus sp. 5B3_DIV0040 TaxID=1834182 RepID=UPI000A3549F2|nr:hypothetical protein [Enterococcus sp. 5B3_DIV0040]OTO01223.1 hypothetical protein A5883_003540 [Enterococcus sp. 5B3_DIV0040]